jgi:hypothetical protein
MNHSTDRDTLTATLVVAQCSFKFTHFALLLLLFVALVILKQPADAAAATPQLPADPQSALFDQIATEIEERQAHLQELRSNGLALTSEQERRLLHEIQQRTSQLQALQRRSR